MPGTGPSPRRSGPWQVVQALVFPLPPVVTSASPFLMLPTGAYATNPDRGLRSGSVYSSFSSVSRLRKPIALFLILAVVIHNDHQCQRISTIQTNPHDSVMITDQMK